ncbi:hypothetical protein HK097_007465 [Rhizophlyctis rosea]|uniref:Uncharacterized protein n=1 Tax=Rhizophlyctis rosea TaxID=64517 RepID=A0AAD5SBP0_9FUNG|nr:hypothetical protein HK097_007465 [Rhizophlyctis rosea]
MSLWPAKSGAGPLKGRPFTKTNATTTEQFMKGLLDSAARSASPSPNTTQRDKKVIPDVQPAATIPKAPTEPKTVQTVADWPTASTVPTPAELCVQPIQSTTEDRKDIVETAPPEKDRKMEGNNLSKVFEPNLPKEEVKVTEMARVAPVSFKIQPLKNKKMAAKWPTKPKDPAAELNKLYEQRRAKEEAVDRPAPAKTEPNPRPLATSATVAPAEPTPAAASPAPPLTNGANGGTGHSERSDESDTMVVIDCRPHGKLTKRVSHALKGMRTNEIASSQWPAAARSSAALRACAELGLDDTDESAVNGGNGKLEISEDAEKETSLDTGLLGAQVQDQANDSGHAEIFTKVSGHQDAQPNGVTSAVPSGIQNHHTTDVRSPESALADIEIDFRSFKAAGASAWNTPPSAKSRLAPESTFKATGGEQRERVPRGGMVQSSPMADGAWAPLERIGSESPDQGLPFRTAPVPKRLNPDAPSFEFGVSTPPTVAPRVSQLPMANAATRTPPAAPPAPPKPLQTNLPETNGAPESISPSEDMDAHIDLRRGNQGPPKPPAPALAMVAPPSPHPPTNVGAGAKLPPFSQKMIARGAILMEVNITLPNKTTAIFHIFQNDDVYEVVSTWCKEHHQEAHLAVIHNYVAKTILSHIHSSLPSRTARPTTRTASAAAAAV